MISKSFFPKLFNRLQIAKWAVAAMFLVFTALNAQAQTEPEKQQLPTTPMPGGAPERPSQGVIVEPAESPERQTRTREPQARQETQEKPEEKVPFGKRLMVSGNFGLQFGDWTVIDISPMVGYRFSDRLVAGPGVVYQYQSLKGFGSYHIYGGKIFGRALVYKNFFAHTEYELLNLPRLTYDPVTREMDETRTNISSMLVGGGYRFMIGARSSMDAMILINLLDSPYSPYANPIIRIGFTGGW